MNDARTYTTMASPVGRLTLVGEGDALAGVFFENAALVATLSTSPPPGWVREDRALAPAAAQLAEYFAGTRTRFDVALALRRQGTPFQRAVWDALLQIPYGETTSYGALARVLGRPGASRAVGAANSRNPLAIVVPCHRVIGADGSLTGYAGALPRKRALLALEARVAR